ncbi:hypothetical protein [Burkholderia phage FLC9]|nr:hypothetical protein [Burkholderia phage FLC9]
MRRVRFYVPYSAEDLKKMEENEDYSPDTRAMVYPTKYPHWFSGSSMTADIVVAFAPDEDTEGYIKALWPEFNGEFTFNDHVDKITSSDRFPINYDIYDEFGVARAPGYTAAELKVQREQLSADLAEAVKKVPPPTPEGMLVVENQGVVIFTNNTDPKAMAQTLVDLEKKIYGNLSD